MKRAFSTLACMELSFEELLSTAVRHGMTGVEIRLDKDQKICGAGVEKAGAIREACEKYGVTITDLATGVTIQKYHPGLMETAKACADLASAAGCRAIRVFAGAGLPRFSDIPCHDEDGIVRFLGELCAYAAGIGVDVWLETHGPYSPAKDTRRLIEKTGGILQGMSGSPIVQNSMLVGAVTHVFVNDPTRGYGVSIQDMLRSAGLAPQEQAA